MALIPAKGSNASHDRRACGFRPLELTREMMTTLMKAGLLLLFCALGAVANAAEGVPAFKVTAPNGAESTLIGSMHIPYVGLRQPAPTVLDGANHLVIEHTTADQKLDLTPAPEVLDSSMTRTARRADWAQFLTIEQVEHLRSNISCYLPAPSAGEVLEIVLQAKSPRIAESFAYAPCDKEGKKSRDEMLNLAAAQRRVPIVALERQDEVESRRRQVPDRLYLIGLKAGLAPDINCAYADLVGAFNIGDFDSIARLAESVYTNPSDRALFHRLIVGERNVAWMSGLRAMLDQGRAVVLVGAAHLPGSDGIIALLREGGYQVEPVILPATE